MVKQIFNEADYRRRIEANDAMSTGREIRLVLSGRLHQEKQMQVARAAALAQARRELRHAIRTEEKRVKAANNLIWTAIEVEYLGHQKEEIELVGL